MSQLVATIEKNAATSPSTLKATATSLPALTTKLEMYVTVNGTPTKYAQAGDGSTILSGIQVFQTPMAIALGSTDAYVTAIDGDNQVIASTTPVNIVDMSVFGGDAICFLGSAPVLTPTGWARIDSLSVGDLVRTADGRDVAVVRAKHQRIETPSAAVNPYVIPKGQFGATENLAISPRHCVAVPGRGMVEARDLGLRQLSMRAAFDYYNLELPEWDNMVVAGVEVESLAPKKRVVMTVAELAKLAAGKPFEKVSKLVSPLGDGRVAVVMIPKERKMKA